MTGSAFAGLRLDGTVLTDPADIAYAAADFGGIVSRLPIAVLRAGSATDISAALRMAAARGIPVTARGCGHTAFGQAQIPDGLVIDLTGLDKIHDIAQDRATVDAGTTWSSLLAATLKRGLMPPVLTDYLGVSVGGTLSVGGIGGTSHRYGVQTDNVLSLDIVTGDGELRTCSATESPDLFHAALGGFGRCGIITRATVALVPAPERVRRFKIYYATADELLARQRELLACGRFDFLQGQILPADNGWRYLLDVATYYTPPREPDDAAILQGLGYHSDRDEVDDLTFQQFAARLDDAVTYLESTGEWHAPHPWPNLFLPDAAADAFVREIMTGLTHDDLGAPGLVLIYPVPTEVLTTRLFRVPHAEIVFLVAGLHFVREPGVVAEMIDSNRRWYDAAVKVGGTSYPTGAIPFTDADWTHHLGTLHEPLRDAKRRYDRHGLFQPRLLP